MNRSAAIGDEGALRVTSQGRVRVLTLATPPVNALGLALRLALQQALAAADADPAVEAVVLTGAGRGFSAGGDLREFGTPAHAAPPTLAGHLQPQIERLGKPVIAALHGFAMGGGFETALACHYRVARPDTRLGLPEVEHGLIPPSGSQRLPRAIGVSAALAVMLGPVTMRADALNDTARAAGLPPLFDACDDADPVAQAVSLAAALAPTERRPQALAARLLRARPGPQGVAAERALAAARQGIVAGPLQRARLACVEAVQAACGDDFDAGLQQAWQHFVALREGPAAAR